MKGTRVTSLLLVLLLSLLALAPLTSRPAAATEVATITDLGTLGGSQTFPLSLNNTGQVVGWGFTAGDTAQHAFLWTAGRLSDLGGPISTTNSQATGINDRGQVSGYAQLASGDVHAVLWDTNGVTDLGTLGGRRSFAYAINARGWVVGEAENALGISHAVVWARGVPIDLGTFSSSSAYALNDRGQIVGQALVALVNGAGTLHAVLWDHRLRDLGTLGGPTSIAYGINARGQVVGESDLAGAPPHAFLWKNGVLTDLGTLGGPSSIAYGINAAGWVVGQATASDYSPHAVLWDRGRIVDLTTLLPTGSGWDLIGARAINNAGQIVGRGLYNGAVHSFLLTLPQSLTSEPDDDSSSESDDDS